MKQKILFLSLILASFNLYGQDVPEIQTPLVTKITATWCSNCGSWGWDLFEGLVEDNSDNAILIAAHYSGNLTTSIGEAFANNFNAVTQPRFVLNNDDQGVTRNSIADDREEIKGLIADMNTQSPVANIGFFAEMKDGKIEVQTKTKFFQAAEGEYYLGIYVLEDGVLMMQSGRGMAEHKAIMRGSFDADAFGTRLTMMNMLGAGMEITGSHSIDIDNVWNTDNLTIVGMIWKKEGDKYQFVNANSTNDFSGNTSAVDIFTEVNDFSVFPTVITDFGTVRINLSQSIKDAEINLYTIEGKKIGSVFSGNLNRGLHTFQITQTDLSTSGMVILVLEKEGVSISRKLFFE